MFKRYCWLLIVFLLLGCTAELAEPVAQSTPLPTASATSLPTETQVAAITTTPTELPPTATFVPTATFHNNLTMTPTPGPRPTQTRTPFMTDLASSEKVMPPVGLIYIDSENQYFLVAENGVSQPVGMPGANLSPDLLYASDGLTITELASGHSVELMTGSGFIHDWWPANPEWLVLAMFAGEPWGCFGICGTPVLARIDGSEQILLAEIGPDQQLQGPMAFHPDGQQMAFSIGMQAYLFDFASGVSQIDIEAMGLPAGSVLGHPSYSPAGDLIVWASNAPEAEGTFGLNSGLLITTASGEALNFIQGYQMVGLDGGFYPPTWSADGNWIAFQGISASDQFFGTFQLQPMSPENVDRAPGYFPRYVSNWLIVQDFDRSPAAYVALGPIGNSSTNIDLVRNPRAMPNPLEDVDRQLFYLPDSEGNIWEFSQLSLRATKVDLPPGSRIVGWLR